MNAPDTKKLTPAVCGLARMGQTRCGVTVIPPAENPPPGETPTVPAQGGKEVSHAQN